MERRRFARHAVAVPVRVKDGAREVALETVDISGGGMSLKMESALLAGTKVKVVIDGFGEFDGSVVDGGQIGRLALDIPEEDKAKLADDIVRKLADYMPV